ncbi:unnamed protein product [Bursaphelenchus xylophilus]|uniref:(pine wood nematode) hypothetical protein n=1 Tax=Bursaphelenchus xylophilus TaxID=6326 RepID=A0A7I8WZ29_BURXY|nr:unnamed protein product [Bursaphelenchus xylophilus]CAG9102262.1 unnamed protein product [Bursaphelenchus xylophilus]
MNNELCISAEASRNDVLTKIQEIVTIGISFVALIGTFYTFGTREKRNQTFHFNFKLILWNVWLSVFLHVFFAFFANLYNILLQAFSAYCDNFYTKWVCVLLRWPISWTTVSLTFLHLAAFTERYMATRSRGNYEKMGKRIGICLIAATWLITVVISYAAYGTSNYNEYIPVCTVTLDDNRDRIKILLYVLMAVDGVTTVADVVLYVMNKREIARGYGTKFKDYSLSKSFQQTENYVTSRLIIPVSLIYSAFYLSYLIIAISARGLFGDPSQKSYFVTAIAIAHYLLDTSMVLCISVYIRISYKMQRDRNRLDLVQSDSRKTEAYFRQLGALWNNMPPVG